MDRLLKSLVLFFFSLSILFIVSLNIEKRSESYKGKEFILDDVAFNLLPKINGSTFLAENTIPFILICVLSYNKLVNIDFIILFTVILILRTIAIGLTILPKTNINCSIKNDLMIGVCHDKMFSGHTAFTTLAMLTLAFKVNKVKQFVPVVIILQGLMMLIARAHYSIDIYIGFLVTLLVYTNKHFLLNNLFL